MKKQTTVTVIPDETLVNKIYFLRNEKVMLVKDLAMLYGVKAIRVREQVKRNLSKFPKTLCFS